MSDQKNQPKKGTSGMAPQDQTSAPVNRTQELHQVVKRFLAFHQQWQDDPRAPNPPSEYFDLADEVIGAFHDGGIPGDCRALAEAVKAFHTQADAFMKRADQKNEYLHREFWAAVERIQGCMKHTEQPSGLAPLESMVSLAEAHIKHPGQSAMTPEQIAKVWDCPVSDVIKELETPGSVCTEEYRLAAEARRLRPTTRAHSIRDQDPIDVGEVQSMILGDMKDPEIAAATGASVEEVARIRSGLRRQKQLQGA
jgi:hypothetical protein